MMKRVFALLFVIAILATMSVAAVSAEETTEEETTPAVVTAAPAEDTEVQSAIKALVYEDNKDKVDDADGVLIDSFQALSNGTYLFQYSLTGMVYNEVLVITTIGGYEVSYGGGRPYYVYNGSKYSELEDAYKDGIVTDKELAEAAASDPYIKKIEKATEKATVDQATPDQKGASGPAIKTGFEPMFAVLAAMVLAAGAVMFYRRKPNK